MNLNETESPNQLDPFEIFSIAQKCNSGEIPAESDAYIKWFQMFLKNDVVLDILEELDSESYVSSVPIDESMILKACIIEAGLNVGLYYCNSSDLDELRIAREAIYDAFIASRFDYIEVSNGSADTNIVALLSDIVEKIESFDSQGG